MSDAKKCPECDATAPCTCPVTVIMCPKEGCDGRSDEGDIRSVEVIPGAHGVLGLDRDGCMVFDDECTEEFGDGQMTETWGGPNSADDRARLECTQCFEQFPLGDPPASEAEFELRLKAAGYDAQQAPPISPIRCLTCHSPFSKRVSVATSDTWIVVVVECDKGHLTHHLLAKK